MSRTILLRTNNELLIREFSTYASMHGATLDVSVQPTVQQCSVASMAFLDEQCTEAELLPIALRQFLIVQNNPSAATWQIAAQHKVENVVLLPDQREWVLKQFESAPAKRGRTIAVVGISGGVGVSSIACGIGLASGPDSLVIDCNRFSGGLDLLLGVYEPTGVFWQDALAASAGLSEKWGHVPQLGELKFLTWRRQTAAHFDVDRCIDVITDATKNFDTVILDLPLHIFTAPSFATDLIDDVVLVTPTTVAGCASLQELIDELPALRQAHIVVREMPQSSISALDVTRITDTSLCAIVSHEKRIVEYVEQGLPFNEMNVSSFNRSIQRIVESLNQPLEAAA